MATVRQPLKPPASSLLLHVITKSVNIRRQSRQSKQPHLSRVTPPTATAAAWQQALKACCVGMWARCLPFCHFVFYSPLFCKDNLLPSLLDHAFIQPGSFHLQRPSSQIATQAQSLSVLPQQALKAFLVAGHLSGWRDGGQQVC